MLCTFDGQIVVWQSQVGALDIVHRVEYRVQVAVQVQGGRFDIAKLVSVLTEDRVEGADGQLLFPDQRIHGEDIVAQLLVAKGEVDNVATGHGGGHQLEKALEPRVAAICAAAPVARRDSYQAARHFISSTRTMESSVGLVQLPAQKFLPVLHLFPAESHCVDSHQLAQTSAVSVPRSSVHVVALKAEGVAVARVPRVLLATCR